MDMLLLPYHSRLLTEWALDRFVTSFALVSLHSSLSLSITPLMTLLASLSSHFSPWSTQPLHHSLSLSPTHDDASLRASVSASATTNHDQIHQDPPFDSKYWHTQEKTVGISLFFLHLWSHPTPATHPAVSQPLLSCLIMGGYKRS